MRAARLRHPLAEVSIDDVEPPRPAAGEALVRVEACGLCGSDALIASLRDLPKTPLILGHEAVGRIVEAGEGVAAARVGERVALTYLFGSCGRCERCLETRPELCREQIQRGYHVDGAFAPYATGRADFLARVPEELAAVQAAPLSCAGWTAFRAVEEAGEGEGRLLAIFGLGGLGALGTAMARLKGWRVAAIDRGPEKTAAAERLGAERAIDAEREDPARTLRKMGGADAAITFTAAAESVTQAAAAVRRGGVVVLVGLAGKAVELVPADLVLRAVRLQGSFLGRPEDLPRVFALAAAGKISIEAEACSLEALPDALRALRAGRVKGRRVVVFEDSDA